MIIDTSVLSALVSKNVELREKAFAFFETLPSAATSVVVIYETEYGLRKANSKKALASFRKLIDDGDIDVISVSPEIAALAAEKRAEMAAKGITLHTEDLFIGATAKILDLPIATQNRRDFEPWGIEIIAPLQ
ncbi:type II toxin-antitoxin system VapC family toxin [Oligoflexus tunisiensis]|uniref:type II toxin-antitoxin system VapC family toxin n=1 Tax=Oligoflexus tunisiensis TaxID=708132 RepID=UPI00159EF568|nr:type II toxin-antitoxin system VapC family toxin [Oligoflexus tunisiensis]